jgi:glycosyltransferase involved in cell wall biosynthesis
MLHSSGIGTYLCNLIPLIIDNYPDNQFNLFCRESLLRQYSWSYSENIALKDCQCSIYSICEQFEIPQKIQRDSALFWSPHYNIPLFVRGRLLVTVHDVFHLTMPQFVGGLHKQLYAKGMFAAIKRKADKIICVSEFTKNELVRFVGVNPSKIRVIYNGIDKTWFGIKANIYPHEKPYLLFVGNVKPHKNLVLLLKAFESIMTNIPQDLIIVGKKEGFITGDKIVQEKAAKLGDRVHFTGHVSDEILKQYYAYADAMVFPSLYEGFGFPPLEAMACGCPTIVSNVASLPEVCGDAALYCDPYRPNDIAEKILFLLTNASLQSELRERGIQRAKQFTWEKCAEETGAVIKELIN